MGCTNLSLNIQPHFLNFCLLNITSSISLGHLLLALRLPRMSFVPLS